MGGFVKGGGYDSVPVHDVSLRINHFKGPFFLTKPFDKIWSHLEPEMTFDMGRTPQNPSTRPFLYGFPTQMSLPSRVARGGKGRAVA